MIAGRALAARRGAAGALLGLGVHRLAELHRGLGEPVGLGADRLDVVALDGLLEVRQRGLDRAALGLTDL